VVCNLVSYIRALDTSQTYPKGERLFRADVVRVLIRLTRGRLGAFLTVGGLREIDLAMFDFRGADLTGIDFSNSFAIECDFRDTTLDGANLRRCSVRNARFNGASLVDVDFTESDWFNALGLNTAQLASCRTDTLLDCPATENEFMAYLATHYGFSFRSWGRRVQRELREVWADYNQPEGLAADVRSWRRREWAP
jgi:hypothetical protein